MYRLLFSDNALKSLKRLSKAEASRILDNLEELAAYPELKSNVKRLRSHPLAIYRLRVGNYRILFNKEEAFKIIEIIGIGHRKNIY